MTATLSRPPALSRRSSSRRESHAQLPNQPSSPACEEEQVVSCRPLAGYLDADGRQRELLAIPAHGGSRLVLDRDATTLCDRRLVAHLAADEPPENAELVCRHYLADTNGHWCRRVRPEDLEKAPFAHGARTRLDIDAPVFDGKGNAYRLAMPPGEGCTPELRWCRRRANADGDDWEQVALRDVIGAVESYEPMRTLTEHAVASHRHDRDVLLTRVCRELERLYASPVVLNRALREAVLDAIDRYGTSMSEIALRCGIVKHDRRGKVSGETSWLARRVGIMPEGGEAEITPWVHSDVLATIARKGLGISPREVELQ